MKKPVKVMLGVACGVAALAVSVGLVCNALFSEDNIQIYYTQVDNSKIKINHSSGGVIDLTGGLPYLYNLPAYSEDGDEMNLEFGMSRQLREDAFLRLEVLPVRGVVNWSELQYDELPEAVQAYYEKP